MRTSNFILLLLLAVGAEFANAASARFYITTSTTNAKEQSLTQYFEGRIVEALNKNFPCADYQTRTDAVEELKWEKSRQLLGISEGNAMENIMESMKCDYLISLNIRIENNTASIGAFCVNEKNVKVLSRTSSVSNADDILKTMDKVAQQLIEGLKQYEICPFVGPVSITINSELDSTNTVDYGVYCNGADQQFHQEMTIKNTTFSDWKLQRKGIPWTEGTMTFYTTEETKITEENGCYKCKSGREGGRTQTQTSSMNVKGNGISHESFRNGKPQDDTRIELKFMENGTYYVIAKGTSQPVTGDDKVVIKAEGTCDNMPQETKVVPREIKIPLKQIFGPYQGKTTDKILQQKETKEVTNPATSEKSTFTIDFTLTQKEK